MLYDFLHLLMRFAFRLYFGKVQLQGLEKIDNDGPTLIIANHTSSFMDPMLLAVHLRRRIHFFARGDAFRKPWANRLLRSLGLLPVYRLQEGKELLNENNSSNEEAIRILQANGAVLVFAEGTSNIAKMLKPLKKGPFRLAVHAATVLKKPLHLTTLGINFLKPEAPQTDAWLIAGDAITIPPLPGNDEPAANRLALQTMRQAAAALQHTSLDGGDTDRARILDVLLSIEHSQKQEALDFARARVIAHRVRNEFSIVHLSVTTHEYESLRTALALDERAFAKCSLGREGLFLLAISLPGVAGWVFHIVPVFLARAITRKYVDEPDFTAAVFCSSAVVLITAWYVLLLLVAGLVAGVLWACALLIVAPLCGIIALKHFQPAVERVMARLHADAIRQRYPESWEKIQPLRSSLQQWLNEV